MKLSASLLLLISALLTASMSAQEIIAHRGYSAKAPENTLAAFALGWRSGADGCELDLHLSADEKIVVIHDANTQRTGGVNHVVAETDSTTLTQLEVGSWKAPKWTSEKIPTLDQALATLPAGKQRFFLEIKCDPEVIPFLAQSLTPMRDRAHQLVIISFNPSACAAAKKALPWLKVLQLASYRKRGSDQTADLATLITQAQTDGLDGLNLGRDWPWSPAMVRTIREAHLGLFVWTVNDPGEARRLAALGVDGITTDDPATIRQALADDSN
jgi:glycerophosphoryl diester phosphodiesterase